MPGLSKSTLLLLIAFTGLTIFIAWGATEPNQYMIRPGTEPDPQPYPWPYPAWMAVFGVVTTALLSLKRSSARFFGALISFLFAAFLVVVLAMSLMHSPPVHEYLLVVMFISSLGLLFYLGYAFAVWRR